jgi:hypothetical protein
MSVVEVRAQSYRGCAACAEGAGYIDDAMASKVDHHVGGSRKDSLVHLQLSPPAISTLHEGRFDLVSHFAPCEDELRDRQLDQSNSVARQFSSHG